MIRSSDLDNQAIQESSLRQRGRPTSEDGPLTEQVNLRLPTPLYDELCREAIRTKRALSEVIRDALHCRNFVTRK